MDPGFPIGLFFIFFGVVAVLILAISGFTFFNVFRMFHRAQKLSDLAVNEAVREQSERKQRALDVVSQLPAGTTALKCSNCGATVDSTSELTPDGRMRCNYCHQWISIYQQS